MGNHKGFAVPRPEWERVTEIQRERERERDKDRKDTHTHTHTHTLTHTHEKSVKRAVKLRPWS